LNRSRAARRWRIALSARAISALRAYQERQRAERVAAGSAWEDLGLVFPNTVGKPLDGTNLLKYWYRPPLEQAGLPPMRFHDLRHTAATLLLSRGLTPKIVSEMLGHASIAITLDIYCHVVPTCGSRQRTRSMISSAQDPRWVN
jgi:integrase